MGSPWSIEREKKNPYHATYPLTRNLPPNTQSTPYFAKVFFFLDFAIYPLTRNLPPTSQPTPYPATSHLTSRLTTSQVTAKAVVVHPRSINRGVLVARALVRSWRVLRAKRCGTASCLSRKHCDPRTTLTS